MAAAALGSSFSGLAGQGGFPRSWLTSLIQGGGGVGGGEDILCKLTISPQECFRRPERESENIHGGNF